MGAEAAEVPDRGTLPLAGPVIEYLGSKRRLLDFVVDPIEAVADRGSRVADLFCGTGSVAGELRRRGFLVDANDNMTLCTTLTSAALSNGGPPEFRGLTVAGGLGASRYRDVLSRLNALVPEPGFVYWTYSPAAARRGSPERRYFTSENAGRIDAIRRQISEWAHDLTEAEHSLLVSDLLVAVSAVSNVAGTYGCYLKSWKPRALAPLELRPREFSSGPTHGHRITTGDAADAAKWGRAPVVYADPPFTKRQYAAYYHVLETIALRDEPAVSGKTGLRDWTPLSSDWCHRRRAPAALSSLMGRLRCEHFFLSYSEDGQIPHETLVDLLARYGAVTTSEVSSPRYRSSSLPHLGAEVVERLYHVRLEGAGGHAEARDGDSLGTLEQGHLRHAHGELKGAIRHPANNCAPDRGVLQGSAQGGSDRTRGLHNHRTP